ncbi:hypothetical protein PLICRDRAFT_697837 [Plicaturopsis crispa FD-325 SS-3]|nr:hypothetical protein PLICRDRAFT_697837 [Plicaturopsis crispa FD-325 SS-3]
MDDESAGLACLNDRRKTMNLILASSVVLFYDHILTFASEIQYMWRRKVTISATLFFVARYPALAGAMLVLFPTSLLFQRTLLVLWLIASVSSELVLALRVWALWERRRWILVVLCLLFITWLVLTILSVKDGLVLLSLSGNVQSIVHYRCRAPASLSKYLWLVPYLGILFFEAGIIGLTFVRIMRLRRTTSRSFRPFLDMLWRYGLFYYVFALGLNIFNITLVLQDQSPELRAGGTQLQACFHTIMATRMILHLAGMTRDTSGFKSWATGVLTTNIDYELEDFPP